MPRDTHRTPAASTEQPTGRSSLPRPTRRNFLRTVGSGAIAAGVATGAPAATAQSADRPFVQTDGPDLVVDGDAVYFHGSNNFWITDAYRGTRERIDSLFDQFVEMGIDLVRTFAACEGGDTSCYIPEPYTHSEAAYETLDYLIAAAGERDIRLVLVLADNWDHNGGIAQYLDWIDGATVHADFFEHADCKDLYRWHVEETLTRENTVNGLQYRDDPTIAFWELCNEPRIEGDAYGEGSDPGYEQRAQVLEDWVREMSGFVSELAPDQLVSTGTEGFYTRDDRTEWFYDQWTGQDYLRLHAIDDVDVATFHWYPYHWNVPLEYGTTWIEEHVRDAHEQLGKPAYMGEFNVNRDSGLETRNQFLAEWYEAADAYDCDAATIWQVVLPEMHDHDGFQVYRSESGDVLGQYDEATRIKSETELPADASLPYHAPTGVASVTTGSSVRADWAEAAGADEYAVTVDGTTQTTIDSHATFDGLDTATEYEISVTAGTGADATDAATATATTVGPSTVDVPAWERGTVYESGDRVVHNGIVWEANWYTDQEEPRFESGYAWSFVRLVASPLAVGSGGDPEPPDPPGPPTAPTDLSITEVTTTSITLDWESVSAATGYEVLLDGSVETTTSDTSLELAALIPNTEYEVGLRSVNDAGTSETITTTVTTADDGSPPEPPSPTCGGQPVNATATVDGRTVCDVDGDDLYRDVSADGAVTQTDVIEFFQIQHRQAWKQPSMFDFSGNDAVGHGDVVALFEHVTSGL